MASAKNEVIDLHRMLGKLDTESTPLDLPSAVALFKSPAIAKDKEDIIDTKSLAERLGLRKSPRTAKAKKASQVMGCTYSWAPETSPVVARDSCDKRVRDEDDDHDDQTLIKKAKQALEVAMSDMKELNKRAPKRPVPLSKRSILKEIGNIKHPAPLDKKAKEAKKKKLLKGQSKITAFLRS